MTLSLGDVAVRKLEVEIYFDEGSLEPVSARVNSLVLAEDQARALLKLLTERD